MISKSFIALTIFALTSSVNAAAISPPLLARQACQCEPATPSPIVPPIPEPPAFTLPVFARQAIPGPASEAGPAPVPDTPVPVPGPASEAGPAPVPDTPVPAPGPASEAGPAPVPDTGTGFAMVDPFNPVPTGE